MSENHQPEGSLPKKNVNQATDREDLLSRDELNVGHED